MLRLLMTTISFNGRLLLKALREQFGKEDYLNLNSSSMKIIQSSLLMFPLSLKFSTLMSTVVEIFAWISYPINGAQFMMCGQSLPPSDPCCAIPTLTPQQTVRPPTSIETTELNMS